MSLLGCLRACLAPLESAFRGSVKGSTVDRLFCQSAVRKLYRMRLEASQGHPGPETFKVQS